MILFRPGAAARIRGMVLTAIPAVAWPPAISGEIVIFTSGTPVMVM